MNLDQVILVDEHDQELGFMDKVEAHRGKARRHRAISVFLFNSRGELLLQQRSSEKIVGALQWANTVCGNLRPGESYQQCAERRLFEELGINVAVAEIQLQPVIKFEYQAQCNEEFSEWEIDQVFAGHFAGEVNLNPHEVKSIKWVDFKSVMQQDLELAPWFTIMMSKPEVVTALKAYHAS